MSLFDDIDVELLIGEVKKYPELWSFSCDLYRDKAKKRAAWRNICGALHEQFHEKTEAEKTTIGNKVMLKWKNIRDQYMKSLKKKDKSGRRYVYARRLAFLHQSKPLVAKHSSFVSGRSRASQSKDICDKDIPTALAADNDDDDEDGDRNGGNMTNTKRMKKNDLESCLFRYLKSPVSEPDEDRAFFDSLLPALKSFTLDQKLEFRTEVLGIVQRIRYSDRPPILTSSYSRHPLTTAEDCVTIEYQENNVSPYIVPHSNSFPASVTAGVADDPRAYSSPESKPTVHHPFDDNSDDSSIVPL